MAHRLSVFFMAALTAALLIPSSAALAKEQPVPGIMEMFNNFNELEESFRNDKWTEATATVKNIEADYKKLVGELKGTVDAKLIQKFGFLITSFKKQLQTKDAEVLEKPFINLQSLFIDIMDYYDYDSPPALIIAARYVDEAGEAVEKNDLDDAAEEMEEISELKDRIVKAFKEKGADDSKIDAFYEGVESVEAAARAHDKEGTQEALEALEAILKNFVSMDED